MQASEVPRAVAAAMSIASALDLTVDDAIVLHDSNKLALRLLPCDVFARVAPWRRRSHSSRSSLLNGSPKPRARWLRWSLEWSRASTSVTASWSRCGPTTNRCRLERSRQPTTRTRSSGCMPACGSSMSRRRTSRIESRRLNSSSRAATSRRRSPTRTGSFSATRCEACDERSSTAAPRSSCCTASRIRATCSARRTGCCSSTSRRVVVGRSSSTSPMCPKRSASAIRALIKNCSASAGASCLRWSPRGAGIADDRFPNGQRAARELLDALREGPPWPALDAVMRTD